MHHASQCLSHLDHYDSHCHHDNNKAMVSSARHSSWTESVWNTPGISLISIGDPKSQVHCSLFNLPPSVSAAQRCRLSTSFMCPSCFSPHAALAGLQRVTCFPSVPCVRCTILHQPHSPMPRTALQGIFLALSIVYAIAVFVAVWASSSHFEQSILRRRRISLLTNH